MRFKTEILKFLTTGYYLGLIKIMPGTFGTFASIPLLFAAPNYYFIESIIVFIFGTIIVKSSLDLEIFSSSKDPKQIVIDEVAGYLFTLGLLNLSNYQIDIKLMLTSFLAFRLFDITKPFPIKNIEMFGERNINSFPKINKNYLYSFSIMIDDMLAGVYAFILVGLLFKLNIL